MEKVITGLVVSALISAGCASTPAPVVVPLSPLTQRGEMIKLCEENETWMDEQVYFQRRNGEVYTASAAGFAAGTAFAASATTTTVAVLSGNDELKSAVPYVAIGGALISGGLGVAAAVTGVNAYLSTEASATSSIRVQHYLDIQKAKAKLVADLAGTQKNLDFAAEHCYYLPRGPLTPEEAAAANSSSARDLKVSRDAYIALIQKVQLEVNGATAEADSQQNRASGAPASVQAPVSSLVVKVNQLKTKLKAQSLTGDNVDTAASDAKVLAADALSLKTALDAAGVP